MRVKTVSLLFCAASLLSAVSGADDKKPDKKADDKKADDKKPDKKADDKKADDKKPDKKADDKKADDKKADDKKPAKAVASKDGAPPPPPGGDVFVVGNAEFCGGTQIAYVDCQLKECAKAKSEDCVLGEWNEWSACLCEGLRERTRVIVSHNNAQGVPCSDDLIATDECYIECLKEPEDCSMSDWGEWKGCDKIEVYQQTRARTYTKPTNGGKGCNNSTKEVLPCPDAPAPEDKDCKWGDWSAFSACTCECDGGQKTRDRAVIQAPRGLGKHCEPLAKTEVTPCNTQSCNKRCVDGEWADWGDWQGCSADCGGGTEWRSRAVSKEANECGTRALGNDKEVRKCGTKSCEKKADCEFGAWSGWSDCSCSCGGIAHRSRVIAKYGADGGNFCVGGTKEVKACHNDTTTPGCSGKDPIDCKLGDWKVGECSATCNGGQIVSTREVTQENKYGGAPCNKTLTKTEPCATDSCAKEPPIDCKWNDWSEWSVCDKCGGQQKRSRTINRMPKNSGHPCHYQNSEETTKCDRECHPTVYCVWSEWKDTSECSTTCGKGYKQRSRALKATTKDPSAAVASLYENQQVSLQSRLQDLVVSFACGSLVTFLVLIVTMRAFRQDNRGWNHIRREPERDGLMVDVRAAE